MLEVAFVLRFQDAMSSDKNLSSKRKHSRRPSSVDVHAAATGDRSGELVFESVDVSIGGAFLRSDLLLELGDQLEMAIPLPEQDPVRALGRVVWVTRDPRVKGNAGMGIEFVDMTEDDRVRLADFLRN
ncbi:MAG TPA: PilZ domain-containing protein [Myxococcota bacterium]|nr:PilZ domain-containing protein [Myxococcota bacterium]